MTAKEVVEAFRPLYRELYMENTLKETIGGVYKMPAIYDEVGFENYHIIIDFEGDRHDSIWALNVVNCSESDDGQVMGHVRVNPDLFKESSATRKMVLAH